MSEPREIAARAEQVLEGLWHWSIANSAIGGATSSCQAMAVDGGCVLIDPLQLAENQLESLPRPSAIVLTARCHQRSAWRYRRRFGVEVWAPEGAPAMDEEPDRRYAEGDLVPGGLRAIRTPGPEPVHYCLLREDAPRILFCSDLLMRGDGGEVAFVPGRFHDDPAETRRSVERLAELDLDVLCLDHGRPVTDDPHRAIEALLTATTRASF
jgi:glyoxylase-like metal-dependent hydrolase (beta-lactamase superfamily II)